PAPPEVGVRDRHQQRQKCRSEQTDEKSQDRRRVDVHPLHPPEQLSALLVRPVRLVHPTLLRRRRSIVTRVSSPLAMSRTTATPSATSSGPRITARAAPTAAAAFSCLPTG